MVKLAASLLLLAVPAAVLAQTTDPTDPSTATNSTSTPEDCPGTTWFQTAKDIAADNSTVTLNEGGQGYIEALNGTFYTNAGTRWNTTALEVGFAAGTANVNTLGGGYTVTANGISVGAGITYVGRSVSFSLQINADGSVATSLDGQNLNCTVDGSSVKCS